MRCGGCRIASEATGACPLPLRVADALSETRKKMKDIDISFRDRMLIQIVVYDESD